MSNIYLCGNTGIVNRGCEAIVRSTVKILNKPSGSVTLTTFAPFQDRGMCAELGINMWGLTEYPSLIYRYVSSVIRKINKKAFFGYGALQRPLFKVLDRKSVV